MSGSISDIARSFPLSPWRPELRDDGRVLDRRS
jgi:hypothetical protein